MGVRVRAAAASIAAPSAARQRRPALFAVRGGPWSSSAEPPFALQLWDRSTNKTDPMPNPTPVAAPPQSGCPNNIDRIDALLAEGVPQAEILDRMERPIADAGAPPLSSSGLSRYARRGERVILDRGNPPRRRGRPRPPTGRPRRRRERARHCLGRPRHAPRPRPRRPGPRERTQGRGRRGRSRPRAIAFGFQAVV